MSSVYEYTNKGKKYDFNTTVLSDEERKKFDGLTDKGKQRFIAAYQLSNSSTMPDEFSVASHVYDATNEPQNTYVNAQVKIDDIKSFLGNAPYSLKIPLNLKTYEQIYKIFYNKYVDEINKLIPKNVEEETQEDGPKIYKPKNTSDGHKIFYWTTLSTDAENYPSPLTQNDFYQQLSLIEKEENAAEKEEMRLPDEIEKYKYILYYNVPTLLDKSQHLTTSDIDNLLRINPKATTDDLINYLNQVQEKANVYTKKNDLSSLLTSILKHTDPKMFEKTLLYPISPETIAYVLKNYSNDPSILKATDDGNLNKLEDKAEKNGDKKLGEMVKKNKGETSKVAKTTATVINATKEEGEPDVTEKEAEKLINDGKGEILKEVLYKTAITQSQKLHNYVDHNYPELREYLHNGFIKNSPKSILDAFAVIAWDKIFQSYIQLNEEEKNNPEKLKPIYDNIDNLNRTINDKLIEINRKYDKKFYELSKRKLDYLILIISGVTKWHEYDNRRGEPFNIEEEVEISKEMDKRKLSKKEEKLREAYYKTVEDKLKEIRDRPEITPKKQSLDPNIYDLSRNRSAAEEALTPIRQREEAETLQGMGIFDRINKRITKDVNSRVDALEKEVEQLKEMLNKQNVAPQQNIPTPPPPPEPDKEIAQPAFAFDTSEFERQRRNLRPTEIIKHQPTDNEFQDSILKVMRERRKDIEPDEYIEDSDDDWGSGLKKKGKIKLTKFLKENEIDSSDDY